MTDYLLVYELDYPTAKDDFRKIIYSYFYKLGKHYSFLNQSNVLYIWLTHVIKNPDLYIGHLFITGHANTYYFLPLKLDECGCNDISHDRLLGDVRLEVESMVLDECKKNQSLMKKGSAIKILSLGPGKGLQDFIIILKLIMLGIKNIELTLIEKQYDNLLAPQKRSVQIWQKDWTEEKYLPTKYLSDYQESLYSITRALTVLSRCFNDACLTIKQYPSVECLAKEKRKQSFDVIYAIDYEVYDKDKPQDKSTSDFNALANYLSKNGSAIISSHYQIAKYTVEETKSNKSFFPVSLKKFKKIEPINKLNEYQVKRGIKDFFQ